MNGLWNVDLLMLCCQLPANAYMVPVQNFSQGMLLTEDMISFHTVNNAATLQLVNWKSLFINRPIAFDNIS